MKEQEKNTSKLYNHLSKEYDALFLEGLHIFRNSAVFRDNKHREYATFYPSFGVKGNEKCEFLILGQAVNGWGGAFSADYPDQKSDEEILEDTKTFSNSYYEGAGGKHTPLDWVNVMWSASTYREFSDSKEKMKGGIYENKNNYCACRSFFWQVTYKLISDYYQRIDKDFNRESRKWVEKMVWSNLYKIAPQHANPSMAERAAQKEMSIQLIRKELDELKPRYCIVLTNGEWWDPFQKGLQTKSISDGKELNTIVFHDRYKNTDIIVTTRPFRGNSDEHVRQILQII